jgi:purine-binding chemotaxis protein CheW
MRMVDLVKIRKKAKEQKKGPGVGARDSGETDAAAPVEHGTTSVPSAVEPALKRAAAKKEKPKESGAELKPAADASTLSAANGVPAGMPPAPSATEHRAPSTDHQLPSDPNAARRSTKLDRFKEEAGRLRDRADVAGATAEAVEQVVTDGRLEVLTFSLAGESFAIDIEHIVEIVPMRTATRVPNADPSVTGILSLRGTIVTLVDVRRRLRHASSAATAESRIVVVEHGGETLGFEVDRVFRVVKLDAAEIEPHPVVHTSELDDSIRGVFRQAHSLTILLDFAKLLDRREMPRAGAAESLASQL